MRQKTLRIPASGNPVDRYMVGFMLSMISAAERTIVGDTKHSSY